MLAEFEAATKVSSMAPSFVSRVLLLREILKGQEIQMNHPIMLELQLHEYLREKLLEEFPEENETSLADTLEGLTSLREKITALIHSQQDDQIFIDGLKVRIGELQDRLKNFETRFTAKKDLICKVMERADIKKIKEPDFTASLRPKNPALVVVNEADIPEDYWRPLAPKLDRQALIRDLKGNLPVPGVALDKGGTILSVRVR